MTDIMCDDVENPPLTRYFTEGDINLNYFISPIGLVLKPHLFNLSTHATIKLLSRTLNLFLKL